MMCLRSILLMIGTFHAFTVYIADETVSFICKCKIKTIRVFTVSRVAVIFVHSRKQLQIITTGHCQQMNCQPCTSAAFDKTFSLLHSSRHDAALHAKASPRIQRQPSICLCDPEHQIGNSFVCWAIFACLVLTGKSPVLQATSQFCVCYIRIYLLIQRNYIVFEM